MEHLVFIETSRDLSSAFDVQYDYLLVMVSILIAVFASYTAFLVAERISYYKEKLHQISWAVSGGLTLASGVWAMHFIGMLAAELPVAVNYDIATTIVSFFPVFIASLILLFNGLKSEAVQKQLIVRSVAIGAGIGLMHYIGMMAMRMDAIMRYDPLIMGVSVIAAIVLSYIALKVKIWAEHGDHAELSKHPRFIAAIIMGSAISAMHYIGMASVYTFPSELLQTHEAGINPQVLAQIIGVVVVSLIALLIFLVHLTRRLDLLNKLKVSEDRMRAILDNVGEAIITIDAVGNIHSFNQAAENIFGYRFAEVVGRNIKMLMTEPTKSKHDGYLEAYKKSGIKHIIGTTRTVEARHKDGHFLIIELSVTELIVGDQVMFTGLLRDVTEREKAEEELRKYREHLEILVGDRTRDLQKARDEALEATRTKSEFLANMSHELRTPLNSIIGFSGIVKDGIAGPVNEEQSKQLSMVYNSAKHLLDLINDILDLSKVEAGKMEVYKEDINFHEMLADVCNLMQPQVEEKHLKLDVNLLDSPEIYHTDGKMLRQVLLNLLSNAIKFTNEGEVSISCRIFKSLLQIEIKDSGIGISKENLEHVFDSFKQLDAGDNRLNEGTGLGLAICREFIELLGGCLAAKSETGLGSTFTIELPIEKVEGESGSRLGIDTAGLESFEVGEKLVLIVDDEGSARELLNTYLKNDGYRTIMCSNGEDAIELAREYKPYAITLDILMPGTDGWSVLSALKKDRELAHIPVIIVSTLDEQHLGVSLGAVDYIQKPVSSEDLLTSLMSLSLGGVNVVVVEDHEQDAFLLKQILEPAGYHVRVANSGAVAIQLVDEALPDVILLDLMMPGMSGFEVIRRLRAQGGVNSEIPIIVVSAKTLTDAELAYLTDNVTKILVKGQFDRDSMLENIRSAIHKIKKSGKPNE